MVEQRAHRRREWEKRLSLNSIRFSWNIKRDHDSRRKKGFANRQKKMPRKTNAKSIKELRIFRSKLISFWSLHLCYIQWYVYPLRSSSAFLSLSPSLSSAGVYKHADVNVWCLLQRRHTQKNAPHNFYFQIWYTSGFYKSVGSKQFASPFVVPGCKTLVLSIESTRRARPVSSHFASNKLDMSSIYSIAVAKIDGAGFREWERETERE